MRLLGTLVVIAAVLCAIPLRAAADGLSATVRAAPSDRDEAPPDRYVELRVGASSSAQAVLCGQLTFGPVSLEGCGTGAGLLHDTPLAELSHYRAHYALASFRSPIGWLSPRVGVGFAELQIGADSPGFAFTGADALGAATAGPEASAGVQSLLRLGAGFELVADLSTFAAFLAHASELSVAQDAWQLGALFSVGIGF
jgi:hypothetical protein